MGPIRRRIDGLLFKSFGILLLCLLAAQACAEPQPLLRTGAVDPIKLLPAPAPLETDEMKAELELVLRLQEFRTPQLIERVRSEEKFRLPAFQSVLGPWLNADSVPKLEALFARLETEGRIYSSAAKKFFHRQRPFVADSRVIPLVKEDGAGYPSGHSMRGLLFAAILAELAPDRRDALMARGREIGWDRVIAGVHFPSDVAAGRVLGNALAQELLANPAFREELAVIRAEFDEARKRASLQ